MLPDSLKPRRSVLRVRESGGKREWRRLNAARASAMRAQEEKARRRALKWSTEKGRLASLQICSRRWKKERVASKRWSLAWRERRMDRENGERREGWGWERARWERRAVESEKRRAREREWRVEWRERGWGGVGRWEREKRKRRRDFGAEEWEEWRRERREGRRRGDEEEDERMGRRWRVRRLSRSGRGWEFISLARREITSSPSLLEGGEGSGSGSGSVEWERGERGRKLRGFGFLVLRRRSIAFAAFIWLLLVLLLLLLEESGSIYIWDL